MGAKLVVYPNFKIGNNEYVEQDPVDGHTLLLNRTSASICQSSEWGMRMIGGSFPRLKDPLGYE